VQRSRSSLSLDVAFNGRGEEHLLLLGVCICSTGNVNIKRSSYSYAHNIISLTATYAKSRVEAALQVRRL
jgi:hypothetical protein